MGWGMESWFECLLSIREIREIRGSNRRMPLPGVMVEPRGVGAKGCAALSRSHSSKPPALPEAADLKVFVVDSLPERSAHSSFTVDLAVRVP